MRLGLLQLTSEYLKRDFFFHFSIFSELNRRVSDGSAKTGRIVGRPCGVLGVSTLAAPVRGCVLVMEHAKTDNAGMCVIHISQINSKVFNNLTNYAVVMPDMVIWIVFQSNLFLGDLPAILTGIPIWYAFLVEAFQLDAEC